MSGYFNAKLIDEVISGKMPRRKKEDGRKATGRAKIGRSFLVINKVMTNGNGEYISKEFSETVRIKNKNKHAGITHTKKGKEK